MGGGDPFSKAFGTVADIASYRSPLTLMVENKPVRQKISKSFQRAGDLFIPGMPPPLEFPEEEGGGPGIDEEEARLLAQKRRSRNRARRGRSSLRIDLPVRNPGISAGIGSGLRIP